MDNSSFSGEISNEKIEITTNITPQFSANENKPETDVQKSIKIGYLKDGYNNKFDYSGAFIIESDDINEEIIKNENIIIYKEATGDEGDGLGNTFKINNKIVVDVLKDKDGKEIKDFSNLQDGTYSGSLGDYITTENSHNYERIIYKGGEFNITVSGNTFKGTVNLNGYKYAEVKKREKKDGKNVDTILEDIYAWKNEIVEETKNISGTIVNGKIEGMNVDGEVLGRCLTGNEYGGINHYMDWNVRLYIPNGTTHYVNRLTMYFK